MKNKQINGLMIISSLLLVGCGNINETNSFSSENDNIISSSSSQVETSSGSSTSSSTSIESEEFSRYEYFPLPDGTLAIGVGQNKYLEKLTIPQMHDGKVVTKIAGSGFSGCTALKEIEIPNSITEILEYAFSYCTRLTNITIPNSVTTIGSLAFNSCISLTNIIIPNSVTTIGGPAFSGTSLIIYCEAECQPEGWDSNWKEGYTNKKIIWGYVESGQYNDFTYAICINKGIKYAVITGYNGVEHEIEIPSLINGISVTTVGSYAFDSCTSLTRVTIPNSVTTIGDWTFYHCTSLTRVTIPNSVTTIGDEAFYNCTSLTSVTIPNSVTTIGSYAFSNCTSLTNITIPNSVITIGTYAFGSCTSLAIIYCEAESQPEGWDSNWLFGSNAEVKWGVKF